MHNQTIDQTDEQISSSDLRRWLLRYADRIEEKEGYLTELDAAIGDADHGINMRRGTVRLQQKLSEETSVPEDVASFLRSVAMTLLNGIGGAAGALYGSFFLHAARDAAQQEQSGMTISLTQFARIFRSGLEGVKQRGKAVVGEKTMIDTLEPAVEALERSTANRAPAAIVLATMLEAAESGMTGTIPMEASKGRASYLGARSIGHQDPGATSIYYLVESAAETLGEIES